MDSGRCGMTTYAPDSDVLTGGEWVRRGAVWYWRSARTGNKGGRPALPVQCSTERGYQRHRYEARKGRESWPLPPDDPCGCRAAHAAHEALRKQMREVA